MLAAAVSLLAKYKTQLRSSSLGESCSSPSHRHQDTFVSIALGKYILKHAIAAVAFNQCFMQPLLKNCHPIHKAPPYEMLMSIPVSKVPPAPQKHPRVLSQAQPPWQRKPLYSGASPSWKTLLEEGIALCQPDAGHQVTAHRSYICHFTRKLPIHNW